MLELIQAKLGGRTVHGDWLQGHCSKPYEWNQLRECYSSLTSRRQNGTIIVGSVGAVLPQCLPECAMETSQFTSEQTPIGYIQMWLRSQELCESRGGRPELLTECP